MDIYFDTDAPVRKAPVQKLHSDGAAIRQGCQAAGQFTHNRKAAHNRANPPSRQLRCHYRCNIAA